MKPLNIKKPKKLIANLAITLIIGFAIIFRLPMMVIDPDEDLWYTAGGSNYNSLHGVRASLLLRFGADMLYTPSDQKSALWFALERRKFELLTIMFKYAGEHERQYILDYAARANDPVLSAFVLEQMGLSQNNAE